MNSRRTPNLRLACSASLLTVVVLGCAPLGTGETEKIDIVFDPCEPLVLETENASSEEEQRVADAIELWNSRAGSMLTLDEVEHAPLLPVVFDDAPAAFNGHYDDEEAVVYINHDLSGHETSVTVAHELGHAFGLYHVNEDERTSVMNHGNVVHEPNDGDVDELEGLWGACGSEPAGESQAGDDDAA